MATNSNKKTTKNTQPRIQLTTTPLRSATKQGSSSMAGKSKAFAQAAPKLTLPTSTFVTASCFSAMHI